MKTLRVLFIAVLVLGFTQSHAQLIKFGVKAGANFPSINEQGGVNYTYKSTTGWHAGAVVQLNIPIVKVGADFLYSANQAEKSIDQTTIKTSHFTMPIYAKLSLLKIIQIHAGPQFNFIINAEEEGQSMKEQWDNQTFSWFAGAGVALGPIDVHARFIFPQKTTMHTVTDEFKNSNVQLSLTYFINNKK